ncbi:MAG TPA: cupin domain-containing protein [Baekduia sp.]|nr:cupin domain-containing protein [Baekduia sp.]
MTAPSQTSSTAARVAEPTVTLPGDGELRWYRDRLVDLRLTGAQTGDRISLVEVEMPAGATTPLHRQPYDDETLYILSGSLTVHLDGEEQIAGPGAVVFIPRETPHALLATETTNFLIFGIPAGQERYFRALSVPAPSRELPPPPTAEPHPAAAIALQQTAFLNGVEILGDPPFEAAEAVA